MDGSSPIETIEIKYGETITLSTQFCENCEHFYDSPYKFATCRMPGETICTLTNEDLYSTAKNITTISNDNSKMLNNHIYVHYEIPDTCPLKKDKNKANINPNNYLTL